jgi:hypothetical protein
MVGLVGETINYLTTPCKTSMKVVIQYKTKFFVQEVKVIISLAKDKYFGFRRLFFTDKKIKKTNLICFISLKTSYI